MSSSTANNVAMMLAAAQGNEEGTSHGSDRRHASNRMSSGGFAARNGTIGREPLSEFRTPAPIDSLAHDEVMMDDSPPPAHDSAKEREAAPSNVKGRSRRASEGAYLSKSDGKRSSGELRCDKCGKGYKHSSCLTKHLLVNLVSLPSHCLLHPSPSFLLSKPCLFPVFMLEACRFKVSTSSRAILITCA